MKKAFIGISFMTIGSLSIIFQVLCAASVTGELTTWSGSRLWYVLFSPDYFDLKIVFIISVILFLTGITLSLLAFFEKCER